MGGGDCLLFVGGIVCCLWGELFASMGVRAWVYEHGCTSMGVAPAQLSLPLSGHSLLLENHPQPQPLLSPLLHVHTPLLRCTFTPGTRLAVAGTIQFAASVQHVQQQLKQHYPTVDVPQAKPLSPGRSMNGCHVVTYGCHVFKGMHRCTPTYAHTCIYTHTCTHTHTTMLQGRCWDALHLCCRVSMMR